MRTLQQYELDSVPVEQNKKLSRAFFIVTAASLVCWGPGTVSCFIFLPSSKRCPIAVVYSFYIFYLGNSLVHPNIYSFKFPMFRNTLQKMRLKKGQYRVSYRPMSFCSQRQNRGNKAIYWSRKCQKQFWLIPIEPFYLVDF